MSVMEAMADAMRPEARAECDRRTRRGLKKGCMGCGACCGRVLPMTRKEANDLKAYVEERGIQPSPNAYAYCCLLDVDAGLCMAYEARPFVCRAWDSKGPLVGTKPGQPCGMRAELKERAAMHMAVSGAVDTWELFGLA
jgi:hypothetical protein